MKGVLLAAAAAALLSGQASAQEAPASKAMQFSVSPSGYESEIDSDAKARQERLLKRMEQADYAVRSICIRCGDSWKHQTYAPFNPLRSLNLHPSDEETGEQQAEAPAPAPAPALSLPSSA